MKLRSAFLLLLVLGTALSLLAQPAPQVPGRTPANKAGKGAKAEEPKIEGTVLNRPDGTYLGLTLHEGKYKLAFYDREKKPMPVNVLRAVARWPNLQGSGQLRTVLNPAGDGTYLLGTHFVRGPHSFRLILVLVTRETEDEAESYSIDFRG